MELAKNVHRIVFHAVAPDRRNVTLIAAALAM